MARCVGCNHSHCWSEEELSDCFGGVRALCRSVRAQGDGPCHACTLLGKVGLWTLLGGSLFDIDNSAGTRI